MSPLASGFVFSNGAMRVRLRLLYVDGTEEGLLADSADTVAALMVCVHSKVWLPY